MRRGRSAVRWPDKDDAVPATVSLPETLVADLRPLVASRAGDESLFINAEGGPVLNATFWQKHWSKAIAAAQPPVDAAGEPDPEPEPDPDALRLTKSPRIHDLRLRMPRASSPRARTCSWCNVG